jgi:hypothetical protein
MPPLLQSLVGGICGSLIRSMASKPGSFSLRSCADWSSLLVVASRLLNQLLPPVNAPSDRADPGKCRQGAFYGKLHPCGQESGHSSSATTLFAEVRAGPNRAGRGSYPLLRAALVAASAFVSSTALSTSLVPPAFRLVPSVFICLQRSAYSCHVPISCQSPSNLWIFNIS